MRRTTTLIVALGCAAAAGTFARAATSHATAPIETLLVLTASNDGAGLPGAPGGKGGASGHAAAGRPAGAAVGYEPDQVFAYCIDVLEALHRGQDATTLRGPTGMGPADCSDLFRTLAQGDDDMRSAQSGQPGRGGDGGSLPGAPGGKGGQAGGRGGDGGGLPGAPGGKGGRAGSPAPDQALVAYCTELLRQTRREARGLSSRPPQSDIYEAADCTDYFASLDATNPTTGARGNRDGRDGPSVSGGVGGRGGKAGSGPGGGAGGAGGLGATGGAGGKGGAGGASD